jgi:hypothetical protein
MIQYLLANFVMSRIVHRQPTWTWSLVLLSTLLLTPSTAAVVLAALRQAHVATAPVTTSVTPRRATTQEEEALKAAAQSGKLRVVRLEPASEINALAVLAPTRALIALPELQSTLALAPAPSATLRSAEPRSCGSRAPPHAA